MASALLNKDLSIKEEFKKTPLFVQNQVTNQCINDFWSPLVAFGKKKECSIYLTPRSCRAHIPTQGCLTFIYTYKQTLTVDLLILFLEYRNWNTFASMKPYKKAAVRLALPAGNYQFATQQADDFSQSDLEEHREKMI